MRSSHVRAGGIETGKCGDQLHNVFGLIPQRCQNGGHKRPAFEAQIHARLRDDREVTDLGGFHAAEMPDDFRILDHEGQDVEGCRLVGKDPLDQARKGSVLADVDRQLPRWKEGRPLSISDQQPSGCLVNRRWQREDVPWRHRETVSNKPRPLLKGLGEIGARSFLPAPQCVECIKDL